MAKSIGLIASVATTFSAIQFANPIIKPTGTGTTETFGLVAIDWNQDGRLDLVTTHPNPDVGAGSGSVRILFGNPDGTFSDASLLCAADSAYSVAIDSFSDAESSIVQTFYDLAVANYYGSTVRAFEQNLSNALILQSGSPHISGSHPIASAVGQFNAQSEFDTDPSVVGYTPTYRSDIVLVNEGANSITLLLGFGGFSVAGGPRTFQMAGPFSVGGVMPYAIAVSDFNNDGNPDVVTSNNGSGNISILLGTGTGSFAAPLVFMAGPQPGAIQAADINGDGNPDVVVTCIGDHTVRVFHGNGTGQMTQWTSHPVGTDPTGLALADFDQDGNLDFVTSNMSGTLTIYKGNWDGIFSTRYDFPGTVGSVNVVTGDFNGDNFPDIATGNYVVPGSISIILNSARSWDNGFNAASGFPGGNSLNRNADNTVRFDAHGGIGPNHFVQSVNRNINIFSRSGQQLMSMAQHDFFRTSHNGVTYPRNSWPLGDGRVIYDRHSGRFYATAMERGMPLAGGHVLLAVSKSSEAIGDPSDPAWPGSHWHRYILLIGEAGKTVDYPVLAADENGLYVTANVSGVSQGGSTYKVTALAKSSLMNGTFDPGSVTFFPPVSGIQNAIHPADNFDDIGVSTPAWLIAAGVGANLDKVLFWRVVWNQGSASMDTTPFSYQMETGGIPPSTRQKGTSTLLYNNSPGFLSSAVIRNGKLWTVRNVALNSSGEFVSPDRAGMQWLRFNVSSGGAPSLDAKGVVFDGASFEPRFYSYPTLSVNGQGHMFMSFSGGSGHDYLSVFYTYLLASEPASATASRLPTLLKAGLGPMIESQAITIADYSQTVVDCLDDMTFWTTQEYAYAPTSWLSRVAGTWIGEVLSKRPILNEPAGRVYRGFNGGSVLLTGTDFFDPGPSFPNRLSVTVSGGDGISNVSSAAASATQATVTMDVAPNATLGPRHVELINPDGQTSFVQNAITVKERPGTTISSFSGAVGGGSIDTILTQSDGKLLIGGWFTSVNGDTNRKYFARLNSDGSTDTAFNTAIDGSISAMLLQSDGRIMIAGAFSTVNGAMRAKLVRLNSDGTIDQPFSTPLLNHYVLSIIPNQTSGKYYIGGEFTAVAGQNRQRLARLNSDGSVDTSFMVENNYLPINGTVQALVEEPDQKVVVAGAFTTAGGTQRNRIARFNSGGSLDVTFNPGYGAANTIYSVARCADGKFIIGGLFTSYNGTAANRIARISTTGSIDTSFLSSGAPTGNVESVIVEPSGKLLVCGTFTSFNGSTAGRITRLLASGATDPLLAVGTGANSVVYTSCYDASGNIFLGGGFTLFNGATKNGLVKIHGD